MKVEFISPKKYPKTEHFETQMWARLKLGRTVACDVFSIIHGFCVNGQPCYLSYNQFAFLIQCDVSSVKQAIKQLAGLPYKKDKNGNYILNLERKSITIDNKGQGKKKFYSVCEKTAEQWKSEWQALINSPEPEKKKSTRKKSDSKAEQPKSETVTETESKKIHTEKSNRRSFAPKSLDEVKAFWKERCFIKSDSEDFYNYYQDVGWKRSWKDLAQKWEDRQWVDDNKNQKPTSAPIIGICTHDADKYNEQIYKAANIIH